MKVKTRKSLKYESDTCKEEGGKNMGLKQPRTGRNRIEENSWVENVQIIKSLGQLRKSG